MLLQIFENWNRLVVKVFGLRMSPGDVDRVRELLAKDEISIGWSNVGDVTGKEVTKSELRTRLKALYPGIPQIGYAVTQVWRFVREMGVGDIVAIPHGADIHFVQITGDTRYEQDRLAEDASLVRTVKRLNGGAPVNRADLSSALRGALSFRKTTADLADYQEEILRVAGIVPVRPMVAQEGKAAVRSGIQLWRNAFQAVGTTDHGFPDASMIWVKDLGIWLSVKGWQRGSHYRYWNGLGDRPGSQASRNLIVEVNPPDGGAPGRWQGLLAKDGTGELWLLHSGELNVKSKRVQLSNELAKGELTTTDVSFKDRSVKSYFRVANLSLAAPDIVRQTKRFMDACALARSRAIGGSGGFADYQLKAQLFDERIGDITIPAQPEKTVDKLHARIWTELTKDLTAQGFDLGNARVSALGPDLYTVGHGRPYLLELKTGAGSGDFLKGVGQLLVYEQVLKGSFRKLLVLPEELKRKVNSILNKLDITVIPYRQVGKSWEFAWPDDFAPD